MWYTKDLPGAAALRSAICSEEKIDRQLELLTQAVGKAQLGPDLAAFGANGQSKPTELVLDQDDPAREG
jgi:hypothetical protein